MPGIRRIAVLHFCVVSLVLTDEGWRCRIRGRWGAQVNGFFATGTDSQAGLELDGGGRGQMGVSKRESAVGIGAG